MSAGIPELERAVGLNSRDADSWHRLAVAHFDAGRFDEAADCCRRVLEIEPSHAKALANLGGVLHRHGAHDEAERHYRGAIAADPALAPPRFSLGLLLLAGGRRDEAIEQLQRAVALEPGQAQWHAILGEACSNAARPVEAISSLEAALRLAPESAHAHEQLGCCLLEFGDPPRAVEQFRRAVKWASVPQTEASNLLFALNYLFDGRPETIYAEHLAWGRGIARAKRSRDYANDPSPERRLKVGYLSPDFREHPLAYFIEPVLARHDRMRVEAICYSDNPGDDAVTARLREHADLWRDTANLDAGALAQRIRDDRIDILIDLAGHSAGGKRLPLFALEPAPLQASWLGYLNTTGLPAMDYRITDATACPPGWERFHSERLLRLPDSQWCFAADASAPPVGPLPASRDGAITFGSLHNLAKVSPQLVALWSRLLQRVRGSRLLMFVPGGKRSSAQLEMRFAAHGIDAARIEFTGRLPVRGFLELHNRIDINLDAFPYAGGTTTCHSLWMGVPVVTMQGDTVVSRGGASLLNAVGLPELVAGSESQYLEIAERLAGNPQRLALLRKGLRERAAQSPLMDAARFTANLESAYRDIWRRWCSGSAP